MNTIIDYTKVPHDYTICIKHECKQANSCLRQLVEQSLPDHVYAPRIIHPRHLIHNDHKCSYYRPSTIVYYAKGCINMLGDIPQKDIKRIANALKQHFGYRTYYRMRKGERLISPTEQKSIKALLALHEFMPTKDFDAYEENYLW